MDEDATIQIDPKQWVTDLDLRLCSTAARGLFVELMCLFAMRPGQEISSAALARLTGDSAQEIESWLDELTSANLIGRSMIGATDARGFILNNGSGVPGA